MRQALFHLPGRAAQGFLESLFQLMGLELLVPDHSTLSRRIGQVSVELPVTPVSGAMHLVVDSTGVKVYGEGEWKVRIHGVGKRQTWRKLHVGVNEATGEIWSALVMTNDVSDDLQHWRSAWCCLGRTNNFCTSGWQSGFGWYLHGVGRITYHYCWVE